MLGVPGAGLDRNKQTIRATPNPLDRSTIFSIYPRAINEVKHTLQPGRFHLDAGSIKVPARAVFGSSSWWKELDADQPLLEIPVNSILIADSIVKDYCNGLVGCDMVDKMPGIFFIPGEISTNDALVKHSELFVKAERTQKNWFQELVRLADILWSRSNGNPLTIGDDMRLAAQELNMKEKPWMIDFTTITLQNCPFCGMLVRPGFPVCSNCRHVVDEIAYKKMSAVLVPDVIGKK